MHILFSYMERNEYIAEARGYVIIHERIEFKMMVYTSKATLYMIGLSVAPIEEKLVQYRYIVK